MPRRSSLRSVRVRRAQHLADRQGGVLSRPQLYELGVTRGEIRGHVRAGRWRLVGDQSVQLGNTTLADEGERWAAVFQGGPRACLDGASALLAAGLERFQVERVRVSVPRGTRVRRNQRFDIRQTRRWSADDVVPVGIPRTRPATAAVRAALWARTDREASYVVMLAVQQGLVTVDAIGAEVLRVRRDWRTLLHAVVNELLDGARSLGGVDVGMALRRRGLPPPARQVLRRDGRNRYYLDLYWPDYHLVVEVDGIHHAWVEHVVGDALRRTLSAWTATPCSACRSSACASRADEFLDQIEQALRAGGWSAAARSRARRTGRHAVGVIYDPVRMTSALRRWRRHVRRQDDAASAAASRSAMTIFCICIIAPIAAWARAGSGSESSS